VFVKKANDIVVNNNFYCGDDIPVM